MEGLNKQAAWGQARFEQLAEQSGMGFWETDAQGLYTYASPFFQTLLGYASEELVGRLHFYDLHPPAGREGFQAAALALMARKEAFRGFESAVQARDGRIIWLSTSGLPILDQHGHLAGYHGANFDITGRKQAEEALRSTHERLAATLHALPDLMFELDAEGRYLDFHSPQADLLYVPPDRFLGKTMRELLPAEVVPILYGALDEARATGRHQGAVYALATPRGPSWFELSIAAKGDPASPGVHFIVLARDITERKRGEAALRQSEERLALALKATQDAVWDWDLTSNTYYFSPAWWSMVGLEEPGLDPDSGFWRELIHPQDLERADRIISAALKAGATFDLEVRLRHQAGHYVPVLVRGFVMRDSHGNPVRISGANTDLTERKRAEAERERLEAQNRRLQKAESLNRMAGAVAHHFNNKLGAVMLSLSLAQEDRPHSAVTTSALAEALQSTRQAAEVSSLMLTYLGQMPPKQEPMDLAAACQRSLPRLVSLLPAGVRLLPDLPSSGPVIQANVSQVQQVLASLVTNAWEACGCQGGTIRVAVSTAAAAEIPDAQRHPADVQPRDSAYGCLEVADQGCGIAAANLEQIFDPFFSTKFAGRGLGLAVVVGVLRAHGGFVAVVSQPGHGSAFRAFWPLAPASAPPSPVPAAPARKWAGGGAVLLAEDEPCLRSVVARGLKALGFAVHEAEDGAEAVELFQRHRSEIRVVLCDLTMPHMDGWETIAALRQLAPGCPVILASGYSEAQVMAGSHAELPQAFLPKPYDFEQLRDTVLGVLGNPGQS